MNMSSKKGVRGHQQAFILPFLCVLYFMVTRQLILLSKEFLLINPSGLMEDLHFATPYELMDRNNSRQPGLKSLGERLMQKALPWGTSLINVDTSRKRRPDILSSRYGTTASRKHHLQSLH